MFSKIFYGAVLGSLVFAATETFVHAAQTPQTTKTPRVLSQAKRFRYTASTDVTRGRSAPELGFVVDILDMKDWKSLREKVETTPFSSLARDGEPPQKSSQGGS